jgi:K+-transporting ATPase ATPase C chain
MDMSGKDAVIADGFATLIPADAVTASGSGLDPHISPENAALQAPRVVDERNKLSTVKLTQDQVLALIRQNTDGPSLGILGDAGVNVLMLNIALDKAAPLPAPASAPASSASPAATAK